MHLGPGAVVEINVFNDWLSSVLNWAEQEAIDLVGGIVCLFGIYYFGLVYICYLAQPAAFYSKSLAFRPDTLIPDAGLESLFKFIQDSNKGTLVRWSSCDGVRFALTFSYRLGLSSSILRVALLTTFPSSHPLMPIAIPS